MALLAFGLNHTTAPLEVREKVAFGEDALSAALSELTGDSAIDEAAILSTCNRTEIYCNLNAADPTRPIDWFSGFHGCRDNELRNYLYTHPGASAVKHVLRVASGLDSMVLGEPQVLGQLKQAYQTAIAAGSIGKLLNRLFQHSFKVAKDVRSNTMIGNHPVSVAYAAVRLARQIFGDLSRQTVLLIGAGETIELAAKHLHENGLRKMIVANRTLDRAQHLAQQYSAYTMALEKLPQHLDEADIIISSTASPAPLLRREMMTTALLKRKHRPVFILDIAVPRDVEATVGELEDVYLYTVDDLQGIIDDNIKTRREAVRQAEQIIDTEVTHFMDWINSQDAVATIRALRKQAQQARAEVLEAALQKLRLGAKPEELLHEITRTLTNKLIHPPSARLNRLDNAEKQAMLRAVQDLYNLMPEDLQAGDGE
ncbi:MAG: glutamyl-tRNA reductase [Gammaproteobacteria bacterium]|nr:glutamyl-tRNA reductase [Gammaproteobacteria bacterium]MCY4210190.1 glutamyl-tRNA reductase [Gammaproteobacteria bacterium]MCY4337902.1 glutamyl-tRNA reductase [Gammaproteobacteria bacterium]